MMRAFRGLPDAAERHRPGAGRALGDQDLAALRPHRRAEPEQRRQRRVAEPGGEHDFRRGDRLAAGVDPEVAGRGLGLA